jgi:hypothetical protein
MKAAELRAIADDDGFSHTREALFRVAEIYEQLAKSAELLEQREEVVEAFQKPG